MAAMYLSCDGDPDKPIFYLNCCCCCPSPPPSCPYLLHKGDPDKPIFYLNWFIDPEYFLFEGCHCSTVSVLVCMKGGDLPRSFLT